MRLHMIVGNWKMHLNSSEAARTARELAENCGKLTGIDMAVAPTATSLVRVIKELAGSNIRVNAVCPGVIATDFTKWRFELEARVLNSTEQAREAEMVGTIPLGRLGSTDEVANLVAFLASGESSYMTGQAINVTGGQLMEL